MKKALDLTIKQHVEKISEKNAQEMHYTLRHSLRLLYSLLPDCLTDSDSLQLLSGEVQYFHLYDQYVATNPAILVYALLSGKKEAIFYVMRAHPKEFARLMQYSPTYGFELLCFFAFAKMTSLLDDILGTLNKNGCSGKSLQQEITHIFKIIVAVDWWEGIEHLTERRPDLWHYKMSNLPDLAPIHYITVFRFEWIIEKISKNPGLCHLLDQRTNDRTPYNLAQVCAANGSLSDIKWILLHRNDMLSLKDWNLTNAIHNAGYNTNKEVLSFLITLLDQKILALTPKQFSYLLDNLQIKEQIKPSERVFLRKHLLQADDFDYLHRAWFTGNIPLIKTAMEHSMTPYTWIIDPTVEDCAYSIASKNPRLCLALLQEYPQLTKLIFPNILGYWNAKNATTIASLIYLNIIIKCFEEYFSVFIKNSHLPRELNNHIMASVFPLLEKSTGLHIVNSVDKDTVDLERYKIKPVDSSFLIQLSFMKPAERYDKFHTLDFACTDMEVESKRSRDDIQPQ